MKIQLETLPHQEAAIKAINDAFLGVDVNTTDPDANYIYANPILKGRGNEKSFIDIKMETGTGKTFVYTQMMYEFYKQGIFKFVIVVPTPSIKEGTKSFITSDYARQYFSGIPGYEKVSIQLHMINAGDFSGKKGRKYFPAELSNFLNETRQTPNQIQVLLINSGMITSKSMTNSDYEQTVFGGESQPMKAIAATRPVVIIDEPHRFKRDKTVYKRLELMQPQLIVRFGATFPEIGTGKNKKTDYYRGKPQYTLNAIDSFNQGLVKGIDILYPDISKEEASNRYKVKKVTAKELTLTQKGHDYIINNGENLSDVDPGFAGDITYEGSKKLSNGLELNTDMQLIPGTFTQSYQEQLIAQAIDKHFEAEIDNFMRIDSGYVAPRVKTISLFFIDNIASFRGSNHSKGWLAEKFELMLTKKLTKLIDTYELPKNQREREYCEFLKATLKDLKSEQQLVYAGYFSEDREKKGDEAIQAEVADILQNKEKLLSFKDADGNWITRRFLFSKWTLREGWDNPNVFVITKLRTSGSEISKIQEVGRGLRLPVDETGHRLQQEEFKSRLSFLIGYDEKDFADTLIGQVNQEAPSDLTNKNELTDQMIDIVIKERQKNNPSFDKNTLLNLLDKYGVINRSNEFNKNVQLPDESEPMSGYEAFMRLFPEVKSRAKVGVGVIRKRDQEIKTRITLRKSNWKQLEKLWKQLSQRQMIKFDGDVNKLALQIATNVFKDVDNKIFVYDQVQFHQSSLEVKTNHAVVKETIYDYNGEYRVMNYGQFLKQLTLSTKLPVNFLHRQVIQSMQRLDDTRYINEKTLANLVKEFNQRLNKKLVDYYSYEALDFTASTSIYDAQKEQFVDSISVNDLGVYSDDKVLDDEAYLYERPPLRYDSTDPELQILKRTYDDKIVVFGKLPKRSVKIPRYDSGTTSPDFIFKINRPDKPVYVVIETKADNKREGDNIIRSIQKTYFDHLQESGVYYRMATSEQEVHDLINKIEAGEFE